MLEVTLTEAHICENIRLRYSFDSVYLSNGEIKPYRGWVLVTSNKPPLRLIEEGLKYQQRGQSD